MATTGARLRFDPEEEIQVDWSRLPGDLLQEISKKLHDVADFIYFRAVCKRWRAATSISDIPPLIPWVLEEQRDSEELRFYSLFSDQVRTIRCPQSRDKLLFGPSRGYLYTSARSIHSELKHSLLNPLTKDELIITSRNSGFRCMSLDPIENDYMAFVSADQQRFYPRFYRPLSQEWFSPQVPDYNFRASQTCLNGFFYMNRIEDGQTVVVDINRGSYFSIASPESESDQNFVVDINFVESAGKILRIAKMEWLPHPPTFHIYQLEDENGQRRWVKITSIGDQALFLDSHSGISITASESTGLRGNYIYYLPSWRGYIGQSTDMHRYNIEDGRTEAIPCPFNKSTTWFVPTVVSSLSDGTQ